MFKSKITIFTYTVAGLYIFFILFSFGISKVKEEPCYLMKYAAMNVVSESMLPTLKVKDDVLVERVKETDELTIGDIYIYKRDGMFIIHRLVDIDNNGLYIFKGDNNEVIDAPVPKDDIVSHYVKTWDYPIRYPYIFIFVGLVLVVVAGLSDVVFDGKSKKRQKRLDNVNI